jgi:DNA-binding winged helix-turn-helix (wHTH) protein/Tol biopolymer transport system component
METPENSQASAIACRYVFDEIEIDPVNRIVRRNGRTVSLTAKVFDILLVFVQNPDRLLDKDELIDKVWSGRVVEESNLARNISTLRKALGDTGKEHKYIITVQGRGYRFVGHVSRMKGADAPAEVAAALAPRHRARRITYWFVGLAAVVGAATFGYLYASNAGRGTYHISSIEKMRLTTGGRASRAVIAPDGDTVVYTENDELKARSLSRGGSRLLIGAAPDVNYISLTLSPGGDYVYYSARHDRSIVSLYRMPLAGGEREWLLDGVYGGICFSPDGRSYAFVRRYPDINEYALLIADTNGSNVRKVAVTNRPNNFTGTPAWSPDGKTILCSAISTDGGFHYAILAVDVARGAMRIIPSRRWAWLGSFFWLPNSRDLLLAGQDEKAITAQLWRLDRQTGEAFRLTDDSFFYDWLSGTVDGQKFVAVKKMLESHVWIVDGSPVEVTTGFDKYDGIGGLAWTPDGRLVYHSRASGGDAIWVMNPDGSNSQQLMPDAGGGFSLSPDGRFLVFQAKEPNSIGLTSLDLTTRAQKRLTENSTDMTPHHAPDGKTIVYSHFDENHSLFRISSDGGSPEKVFDQYRTVSSPVFSPGGEKIAFAFARTQTDKIRSGIAIISSIGNRVLQTFDVNLNFGTIYERPTVQWSADGRHLYFIKLEAGVSNVWKIDTTNGNALPVTTFEVGRIFNFAFSRDGARLALARGSVESDVVVLRPVK